MAKWQCAQCFILSREERLLPLIPRQLPLQELWTLSCELWEQHPGVPLGAAKALSAFSALWFRLPDDHVSPHAGDWNDQQCGQPQQLPPLRFQSQSHLGCCLVESAGAFCCQARCEKGQATGGSFFSLHAKEKVSGEFPGCISSHLVAERRPLGFLMWTEK